MTLVSKEYDIGVQSQRPWLAAFVGLPSMEAMTFVFNSIFWGISCDGWSAFSDSASKRMAVG